MTEISTERLILRQWRPTDLEPFAELNAHPEVMRHFPAPLSRADSDLLAARARTHIAERGWGLWAVEVRQTAITEAGERGTTGPPGLKAPFIGFVGLAQPRFDAHFMPAVEVGWRLAQPAWGHGYANEAARAATSFGFGELDLAEIVSFTTAGNRRSRRVMERLGMTHDQADDFEHPQILGTPLAPHVLYRLRRAP
jgi:RimJ/RimL family protein N-acetyltransferase